MPGLPGTNSGTARPNLTNSIIVGPIDRASIRTQVYRPINDNVASGNWWRVNRNNAPNPMATAIRTDASDALEVRTSMERLSYTIKPRHRKATLTSLQRGMLQVQGADPLPWATIKSRQAMASLQLSADVDWWAQVETDYATASENYLATGASWMTAGTALLASFVTAKQYLLDAGVTELPSLLMTDKALNFVSNRNTEFNAYFSYAGTPSTENARRSALAAYLGVKEIITDSVYNSSGMYGSYSATRVLDDTDAFLFVPAGTNDPTEACCGRVFYSEAPSLGGLGSIFEFQIRDDIEFHARSAEAHVTVDNRRGVRLNWA